MHASVWEWVAMMRTAGWMCKGKPVDWSARVVVEGLAVPLSLGQRLVADKALNASCWNVCVVGVKQVFCKGESGRPFGQNGGMVLDVI